MDGGNGNDTYIVDNVRDEVIEAPNWQLVDFGTGPIPLPLGGTDTVHTKLQEYTLGADVENVTFGTTCSTSCCRGCLRATRHNGYGNELDNVMQGSRGRDTLFGENGTTCSRAAAAPTGCSAAPATTHTSSRTSTMWPRNRPQSVQDHVQLGGIDEIFTDLPFFMLQDDYNSVIEN